jgi:hypothetical protein
MEAAEQRKLAEKARRLEQERARVEAQKAAKEKIAAQTFARNYLGGLISGVFEGLTNEGVFYDPVEREVGSLEWDRVNLTNLGGSCENVSECFELAVTFLRSLFTTCRTLDCRTID